MKTSALKKLIVLCISFIAFTIIGTLSHEYGHIVTAKILGFKSSLHYASMEWDSENSSLRQQFLVAAGGPIQTMLFGSLGFILLFLRRIRISTKGFMKLDWLLFFLALFWSRQVFNLTSQVALFLFNLEEEAFGGDEAYLSEILDLPTSTIPLFTGVLGFFVCAYVVLILLPKKEKKILVSSALIGCFFGYHLWMNGLGPLILP